jgi:predicted ArsR family transcriptional regulator
VTQAPLSDALRRFLTESVGSVERLTLLLFLHRHAARWWAAQALAAELEMPADTVQSHLEYLSARNLLDVRIAESVIYCYKPGREELSALVEETARAHYLHRDDVVAALAPRLAGSARLFADAFQLRKGKKRDG